MLGSALLIAVSNKLPAENTCSVKLAFIDCSINLAESVTTSSSWVFTPRRFAVLTILSLERLSKVLLSFSADFCNVTRALNSN